MTRTTSGPMRTRKNRTHSETPYKRSGTAKRSKSLLERAKAWINSWRHGDHADENDGRNENVDSSETFDDDVESENENEDSKNDSSSVSSNVADTTSTSIDNSGVLTASVNGSAGANIALARFFSQKGAAPLNEMEMEGVMSLLKKTAPTTGTTTSLASGAAASTASPSALQRTPVFRYTKQPGSAERVGVAGTVENAAPWSAFRSTFSPAPAATAVAAAGDSLLPAKRLSFYGPTLSTPFRKRTHRKRHSLAPASLARSPLVSGTVASNEMEESASKRSRRRYSDVPTTTAISPEPASPARFAFSTSKTEQPAAAKTPSKTAASLMSFLDETDKKAAASDVGKIATGRETKSRPSILNPYARDGVVGHRAAKRAEKISKPTEGVPKTLQNKELKTSSIEVKESTTSTVKTFVPKVDLSKVPKPIPQTSTKTEAVSTSAADHTPVFKFTAPNAQTSSAPAPAAAPSTGGFSFGFAEKQNKPAGGFSFQLAPKPEAPNAVSKTDAEKPKVTSSGFVFQPPAATTSIPSTTTSTKPSAPSVPAASTGFRFDGGKIIAPAVKVAEKKEPTKPAEEQSKTAQPVQPIATPHVAPTPAAKASAAPVTSLPTFPFTILSKSTDTSSEAANALSAADLPTFNFSVVPKAEVQVKQPEAAAISKVGTSVSTPASTPSVVSAAPVAPVAPPATGFDWAAAGLKMPTSAPGSWTCNVCMITNKPEATKCAACETDRP
ncbi:nucleoporin Nup60 [Schizosaccharomyces japonicus yFS275]|uniref:Nucleoporin Nup60 n=1 Tax=Schizosaccharomyces japonicus (strain yFS275 / FY16936) TaxID=402676 RepID=B6JYC3_SCHJY|nr:nucleoporin Nup60 [Schizosaccharomyces japonicus yFS275]EEB06541.1 nucleoporin Nup60 [Schizosaccharomyces japonicus yFS275]